MILRACVVCVSHAWCYLCITHQYTSLHQLPSLSCPPCFLYHPYIIEDFFHLLVSFRGYTLNVHVSHHYHHYGNMHRVNKFRAWNWFALAGYLVLVLTCTTGTHNQWMIITLRVVINCMRGLGRPLVLLCSELFLTLKPVCSAPSSTS